MQRSRQWPVLAVLLLLTAIGACGGVQPAVSATAAPASIAAPIVPSASAAVATPIASVAPSPSASPSQEDIRAVAARAYRRAVIPYNKANDKAFALYKGKTTLKANRAFCAQLDKNARAFIKALQAITWPTDTASDAKALIRADAASDANLRTCAKATSVASWQRAWNLHVKANERGHEAANLVRLDLGLNPVPD